MIVEGKVLVVVGVGDGLGREVVRVALRDGARVVAAARSEEKLRNLVDELDPSGERVIACPCDMLDQTQCDSLMETAREKFGGLDAVVNVAALDTLFGSLETTSDDDWMRAMETNVLGTLHVVKAATPLFRAQGGGSVVLVGSRSQWFPPDNPQIAYASSKGALLSSMYHMVNELGPDKIRVNMVVPTWMWGPPVQMFVKWQASERGISEDEVVSEITNGMPLGNEIPKDDDVAEAILFFCSERSRMITGETLQVNAGEFFR
ncbi:MAG: short-chain dehydrogenase [Deltaproteobacteria bacterium]|nr:short-chain dehydrogenase [Deltaproteobacteria bacterium]